MKRKIKYLFLAILLILLIFPKPARADFFGVIDFLDHLTESIEDITQPMMYEFIRLIIFYVVSIALLGVSSHYLQIAVNSQESWLEALKPMVDTGFHFTSGLANIFLILVFIFIAFAYILKLETFEAKRALPRLIIVALLLNFSLLFVWIMVDLSQIIYNTFLDNSVFLDVMRLFFGNIHSTALIILSIIVAIIAAWGVPFAHPFSQIFFTGLFTVFFLPQMVAMFFQMFFFVALATIFAIFIFLFFARVFAIAILAILSPLAFVCMILPQTRKWWSEWLHHLTEWLILGIFFLFFLTLGFKSLGLLKPKIFGQELPTPLPLISWFQLGEYIFYYFAIFVYMTLLLYIGKKYIPVLASTLIEQAKAMGGFIWARGLKPFGGTVLRQMTRAAKQYEEEEKRKRAEAAARGEEYKPSTLKKIGETMFIKPIRWYYRFAPPHITLEIALSKEIERKVEELEKTFGKDIESAFKIHGGAREPIMQVALALYLQKIKGAKGLEKFSEKQLREVVRALADYYPDRLSDVIKHKPELIDDKEVGELIKRTMVPKGLEDPDAKKLIELGVSEAEAIRYAAFKKAVDAMKVPDIENLALSTLENEVFQEMVVRFKDTNFIRRIGEVKGAEYIEPLRKKAQELGALEIARTNPVLLRQSVISPAFKAVFPPIEGAEEIEEVEALIKISKTPLLFEYEKALKTIQETEKIIKEGGPEEAVKEAKERIETLRKTVEETKKAIDANIELKKTWEEIEKLREIARRKKERKRR
jgi:hypothetical protein